MWVAFFGSQESMSRTFPLKVVATGSSQATAETYWHKARLSADDCLDELTEILCFPFLCWVFKKVLRVKSVTLGCAAFCGSPCNPVMDGQYSYLITNPTVAFSVRFVRVMESTIFHSPAMSKRAVWKKDA
jgi:hypothetical protein